MIDFKIKRYITLLIALFVPITLMAQAKVPTIMVVPSDVWCKTNGYVTEFKSFDKAESIPDYNRALTDNPELVLAISKIGEMMSNRGFNLKDLSSTLSSLEMNSIETDQLALSYGGIAESPLDKLRSKAKADILIYITWIINAQGNKRSITLDMHAVDAYSNKQIAAASGTGYPSAARGLSVMVEESILMHIDAFNYQLQQHFNSLFTQGREVTLECMIANQSGVNFDSNVSNDLLSFIIEDWVSANTVFADGKVSSSPGQGGHYSLSDATANVMKFDQVRIPMISRDGRALDTRYWARGLMRELMMKHDLNVSIGMRGLGNAYIIINGKNSELNPQ